MQKALVAHGADVMCGAIQRGLISLYFEVGGVSDSNAMLAALGKIKPALLVVDARLPPFDGVQAIVSVRGFDSGGAKIIAVQTDADFGLAASLRAAGAHEVIMGGYDVKKLEAKLRVLGLLQA